MLRDLDANRKGQIDRRVTSLQKADREEMSDPPVDDGDKKGGEAMTVARGQELPAHNVDEAESTRSQNASRAFRAAVVGLVLLPLELLVPKGQTAFQVAFFLPALVLIPYSSRLLYLVYSSKEKLEPRARRHATIAAVLNASVFLFAVFMLISPLIPRRDPRFEYPREMVGAWVSADGAVEMELRKNGRLFYRAKGPPEIEFSGTWGLDLHFVLKVRRVTKGADFLPFPKDQFVAWSLHHYSDREIVFGGKEKQLRLVRK